MVEDVVNRIDELNGQIVSVSGYLGECFGYNCLLYVNEQQGKQTEAWSKEFMAKVKRGERFPKFPGPAVGRFSLGIGSSENFEFDRKAAPFQHSYVIITGEVTNQCRHKGEFGCTDRTTDLFPTDIRPWKRAERQA
jgi:hypothetical protein